MKKYLVAAIVALGLFSAVAFAASLDVNGGVLQAGQDADLTCADNAVVDWTTQTVGNGQFAVNRVTVTFDDGACDGNFAYVATFSVLGPPGGSTQTGFGIQQISGAQVSFAVDAANDSNALVSNVNGVSVAVKNTDDSGGLGFHSGMITGS